MKTIFIVTYRLARNLTISKVEPFLKLDVDQILLFTSHNLEFGDKVRIIASLKSSSSGKLALMARVPLELIQLIYHAIKYKPILINGFYTVPKGFNSWVASRFCQSRFALYILGGQTEIEKRYMKLWRFWRWLNFLMIKRSDFLFTKGTKDFTFLKESGLFGPKVAIYNGSIDIEKYKASGETRNFDVVFAGSFDKLKGPDRIAEIIRLLKVQNPAIKAIMLGDGTLKDQIRYFLTAHQMEKNIEMPGYVLNPESFYVQSKIVILTSKSEGLSTAMLEAMSCGCVPVVPDVGNLSEAVRQGETGYLVDRYDNINEFVTRCSEILSNEDTRRRMSIKAREMVVSHYSIEVQANILRKSFGSLL